MRGSGDGESSTDFPERTGSAPRAFCRPQPGNAPAEGAGWPASAGRRGGATGGAGAVLDAGGSARRLPRLRARFATAGGGDGDAERDGGSTFFLFAGAMRGGSRGGAVLARARGGWRRRATKGATRGDRSPRNSRVRVAGVERGGEG
jgi:hypothetical protein